LKVTAEGDPEDNDDEEGEEDGGAKGGPASGSGFNYLLSMPIWSLTLEKVQKLQAEAAQQAALVDELTSISNRQMWNRDLDAFVAVRGTRGFYHSRDCDPSPPLIHHSRD